MCGAGSNVEHFFKLSNIDKLLASRMNTKKYHQLENQNQTILMEFSIQSIKTFQSM